MSRTQTGANHEQSVRVKNGWMMLLLLLAAAAADVAMLITTDPPMKPLFAVLIPILVILMIGFFSLQPNEARVLLLFGAYKGTVRESGFHWGNPFYSNGQSSMGSQLAEAQKKGT